MNDEYKVHYFSLLKGEEYDSFCGREYVDETTLQIKDVTCIKCLKRLTSDKFLKDFKAITKASFFAETIDLENRELEEFTE